MTITRHAVGVAVLLTLGVGASPVTPTLASSAHKSPVWATYSRSTRTAHLRVIAGYDAASNGYNFDGGANGDLTFKIPVGAKVVIKFTNMSTMMPHAAEIVKYTGVLPTQSPPPAPAFAGAASPNYLHGEQPGTTVTFHFMAKRAGKYLLICPVHNHVKFGHWDWFIVSKKATGATAVLKGS